MPAWPDQDFYPSSTVSRLIRVHGTSIFSKALGFNQDANGILVYAGTDTAFGSSVIQRCIFSFCQDSVLLVISYRPFQENRSSGI